jgi:hypothetical protein
MAVALKPVLLFAHTSMDALASAIVSGCEVTKLVSYPSDANLLLHVSLILFLSVLLRIHMLYNNTILKKVRCAYFPVNNVSFIVYSTVLQIQLAL